MAPWENPEIPNLEIIIFRWIHVKSGRVVITVGIYGHNMLKVPSLGQVGATTMDDEPPAPPPRNPTRAPTLRSREDPTHLPFFFEDSGWLVTRRVFPHVSCWPRKSWMRWVRWGLLVYFFVETFALLNCELSPVSSDQLGPGFCVHEMNNYTRSWGL